MWEIDRQPFGYTWNYHIDGEWLGSVHPQDFTPCDGNHFSASWVRPSSGHPMNSTRTKTEEEAKAIVEQCSKSLRSVDAVS